MKRTLIILLLLVFMVLPPAPVRADVAPPPVPGIGGLQALDYQKTEVEMRYERVELELQKLADPEAPDDLAQVTVDAWFILRNTGSQAEQMRVVFPFGNFNECRPNPDSGVSYSSFETDTETFSAWVDGFPTPVSRITTPHPYRDNGRCQNEKMDWAAFEVSFPPDRDVVVRISYVLLPTASDAPQNVAYILETGAGWKGPIGGGVIVFRFPYQVEENVIEGTTPGYRTLENEIYWTFDNLEPTRENNIRVNFVPPFTRRVIKESQARIKQNPQDITAWAQLAETYYDMTYIKSWPIDHHYAEKIWQTYEQAIKANPNSPEIAASYASRLNWTCCMYEPPSEANFKKIMSLVDTTLRYDPNNEWVKYIIEGYKMQIPDFTYTPPAVISTLTPTPLPTEPPTETTLPTVVPNATSTTTPTRAPSPTVTSSPTATAIPTLTIIATTAVPTIVHGIATSQVTAWFCPAAGLLVVSLVMIGLWSLRNKTWN